MKFCGDVNVKYLENCSRRQQLDAMLSTHLVRNVHFPTRITNGLFQQQTKIVIDKTRNYTISSFMNDMSDNDAQAITMNNICLQK